MARRVSKAGESRTAGWPGFRSTAEVVVRGGAAVITQEELERYASQLDLEREVRRTRDDLRLGLIARLAAGTPVEPGELRPRAITIRTRSFSAKNLEEALGRDWVEALKPRMPEIVTSQLRLYGRQVRDELAETREGAEG